ncbi:peptide-methionine (S)-S-oxide reductase MsrA [Roseinatronobacter bogoriensis]|uniref:Peptide methionine sulfoxide reductase MsrA n=1 Tax=Roseinatronobacter bogoriensis subsp. barguzinensis TaxID=441209 RepID=A0A2K8K5I6_9RHOB|nr:MULTISPECIES: peptide-methionine (S)-S-oxide reductase MsrA [Rhodobaca]ATX64712.1 peptide-methionine (S)-S-oxide reductase [Rhodobaca barguzinensis]MBB4209441.1 peptide-methionine (S)-S-oxide reductase [Rhodobaca bogoriensis DSM 18756]TDW35193.1 peptide-methionine (S)-S-oxide reductase [Rhodobaca barguzinensis]TDY66797.1 peptide-methionine (S)-S-oxide reductase [Rhodobaca bogoriensis DSM 18756]
MIRTLAALVLILAGLPATAQQTETALVAGGCFWCVESDFRRVQGVTDVRVGFAGGTTPDPTYDDVARGRTDHLEVALITYDTSQIDYDQILHLFLRSVDVLDDGGQFCDRGAHYATAIFATPDQMAQAQAAINAAEAELGQSIVTPVREAAPFYEADEFHQNYANSTERTLTRFGWVERRVAYKGYREGCGRDRRVRELWGSSAAFVN